MEGDEDSKVPNLSLVDFAENDLPLVEKMLTIEGTMLGRSYLQTLRFLGIQANWSSVLCWRTRSSPAPLFWRRSGMVTSFLSVKFLAGSIIIGQRGKTVVLQEWRANPTLCCCCLVSSPKRRELWWAVPQL